MPRLLNLPINPEERGVSLDVQLEGQSWHLKLEYIERAQGWYLHIETLSPKERLVSGRRVVLGVPIFRGLVDPRLPQGNLVALSLGDEQLGDPQLGELGNGRRVVLVYIPVDELQQPSADAEVIIVQEVTP